MKAFRWLQLGTLAMVLIVVVLADFKGVEGGILAPAAPSRRKPKIGSSVKVVNINGKLELSP